MLVFLFAGAIQSTWIKLEQEKVLEIFPVDVLLTKLDFPTHSAVGKQIVSFFYLHAFNLIICFD